MTQKRVVVIIHWRVSGLLLLQCYWLLLLLPEQARRQGQPVKASQSRHRNSACMMYSIDETQVNDETLRGCAIEFHQPACLFVYFISMTATRAPPERNPFSGLHLATAIHITLWWLTRTTSPAAGLERSCARGTCRGAK